MSAVFFARLKWERRAGESAGEMAGKKSFAGAKHGIGVWLLDIVFASSVICAPPEEECPRGLHAVSLPFLDRMHCFVSILLVRPLPARLFVRAFVPFFVIVDLLESRSHFVMSSHA